MTEQTLEEHIHGVFTSVQFIVKFDLRDGPGKPGNMSLAEIWLGGAGVLDRMSDRSRGGHTLLRLPGFT